MKIYFAPLEGITTYPLRRLHAQFFPGVDRYYTPFLTATQTGSFKRGEIRDILPENNEGVTIVPQVLGNHAAYVLDAMRRIAAYGYREINFNLGCSMPQAAKRGRGAGFLKEPEKLDKFFEELFEGMAADGALRHTALSVKTRIGAEDPEEAEELIRIYNRYPICELTVHPRLMTDLYRNRPNLDVFQMIYEQCVHPLCYNGDIFHAGDYQRIVTRFPALSAVMIGRGLIEDPSLISQIRRIPDQQMADGAQLEAYLKKVREGYLTYMQSDQQVLPHMKEIWFYMAWHFLGEPGSENGPADAEEESTEKEIQKSLKKLRKARSWEEFAAAQHSLLAYW